MPDALPREKSLLVYFLNYQVFWKELNLPINAN